MILKVYNKVYNKIPVAPPYLDPETASDMGRLFVMLDPDYRIIMAKC